MDKLSCPASEVVLFCRQLQVMQASGDPIYRALEVLSIRDEHPQFGRAVDTLAQRLAHGHKLSRAMSLFPKVFDLVFIALSNYCYCIGESIIGAFLPEIAKPEALGRVSGWGWVWP